MAERVAHFDPIGVGEAVHDLIHSLGYDPQDEGLKATPDRVTAFWREFLEGQNGQSATVFANTAEYDEMVVVSGIRVWSVCEHHLLPFGCEVTMGYITGPRILGLSKFARIAEKAAGTLGTQEAITKAMADQLQVVLDDDNVAVSVQGEHLCMALRGVRQRHALTTTNDLRGAFKDKERTRAEFLALAR